MIFRTPDYYFDFACIADKCRDNCCIGWEIDIDPETAEYYGTVGGGFGKRLKNNISGGSFVLDGEERCPFLNSRNLCDIYTNLGEEHLCQICTDHPRFFEWFGKVKEGGIGLCCEAAAALILSRDLVITEREIPDEESDDAETYDLFSLERSSLIGHISKGNFPEAVSEMLDYAERRQMCLDNNDFSPPQLGKQEIPAAASDAAGILDFLCTLEPMSPDWIPRLKRCKELLPAAGTLSPEDFPELRRIACYFLFRYHLKAVFDLDVLSRIKLTAVCTWLTGILWQFRRLETGACSFDDKIFDAKAMSKEIEYNEENLNKFLDASYCLDCLSTPALKGLFRAY